MSNINLTPILDKIGAFVKKEAIRRCPVDNGDLRRSIDYRIEGNSVIIFANDPNAIKMEYGAPPGILTESEKDNLKEWAKRHNASPFKIIGYIEKHGIKVGEKDKPLHITSYGRDSYRPFLRPAAYENIAEIKDIVKKNLQEGISA